VQVFHPGFQSFEGGPDFRSAVIKIGDEQVQTGDVEVDLRPGGWRAHGHHRNAAFAKVILHVIWLGEEPCPGAPPTLAIRGCLDAPIGELSLWLGGELAQEMPELWRGRCATPLRKLSQEKLLELLRQAAHVRLRSKAAHFQARARDAGWEQSLWEGLFRALGYKNNVWPMQRLAELRPKWSSGGPDALCLQARLFGISGLLPVDLAGDDPAANNYLRHVWDCWWRERDEFSNSVLPRAAWRLRGSRPPNHPQRRLALACHWCGNGKLVSELEGWCSRELAPRQIAHALLETLQVTDDEFWSWHCSFNSRRFKTSFPLLGENRATDIAINSVLPWLWIRAVDGNNDELRKRIEQRYFEWAPSEDNAVLRLARERLLGTSSPAVLPSAAAQQGLIQIVRDFCENSNAICEKCYLPDLVTQFRA
jgi:hypothetical protein